MPLTREQKINLVDEALRDHFPWDGAGPDTRTLRDLRAAFERRHLGSLVVSYRKTKAARDLEEVDINDIA